MSTATATRKVRVVRKPRVPLNVPVNVKVEGEKRMRKNVTLSVHPDDSDWLVVRTGRRGRPSHLHPSQIVKVTAL